MKRFGIFIVIVGLLLGTAAGCQPQFQPGTYTDDMGREIRIDKVPQRIVSHVPSITEILFALGLEEKVVGVSDYCDYPEAAKTKPKVGNFWRPSVENIVALEPDLVLTNGSDEQLMVQLDSLGIAYLVIDPVDVDGILEDIELLGRVTGVEAAAGKLVKQMKADMSRVVNRVKDAPRVRVFYVIDATDLTNPWTAGPGTFVASLVDMAGGENIAAEAQAGYTQFSIEQVVSADPEVIILPTKHGTAFTSLELVKGHPMWRDITAVKHDKVYLIDADLIDRSGPRIAQGLEEVARMIHPDLFE